MRTLEYDESLRVDCVSEDIDIIAKGLTETLEAADSEVNSLIQMLAIAPAAVPEKREISLETSLILNAVNNINQRVSNIERVGGRSAKFAAKAPRNPNDFHIFQLGDKFVKTGTLLTDGEHISDTLYKADEHNIILKDGDAYISVSTSSPEFKKILKNLED